MMPFPYSAARLATTALILTAGVSLADDTHLTWLRARRFELGISGGNTIGDLVQTPVGLATFGDRRIAGAGAFAATISLATFVTPTLVFYGQLTAVDGRNEYHVLGYGYTSETNLANVIYEGGFQRLLPAWHARRAVPYVLAAAATVQTRADILVNYATIDPQPPPSAPISGATRARLNKASFAPAAGGGVRFFLHERLGLKVEVRSYFPVTGIKTPSVIACGGILLYLR